MPTRITGGAWKGRNIKTPEGNQTRPSSSRFREALFNILGQDWAGRKVVDLYAGSGSVGIEALSRGASFCRFVETDPEALQVLKENLRHCSPERYLIESMDADHWRRQPENRGTSDLLFLDPPFAKPFPFEIDWFPLLSHDGILAVQFPSRSSPLWKCPPDRTKRYGESSLGLWFAPVCLAPVE